MFFDSVLEKPKTIARPIVNYCAVAGAALLFYDYILTLRTEILCIWKRKCSFATLLFFVNRYGILLNRTILIMQIRPWGDIPVEQASVVCFLISVLITQPMIVLCDFLGLQLHSEVKSGFDDFSGINNYNVFVPPNVCRLVQQSKGLCFGHDPWSNSASS